MKTRPNNKIIFHWVLTATMLGLLLFYIENKFMLYLISSIIILSLLLNRITYLRINDKSLLIAKTIFLFIPTFKSSINLKDVKKLSLIDYRDIEIKNSRKYPEFEAVVVVEAITGTLFYKPDYILEIDLLQNKRVEIEINAHRKGVNKIMRLLQKQIHELNK